MSESHGPHPPIKGVFFDYDGVLTTNKTGSLTTCRYLSSQTAIDPSILTRALRRYTDDLTIGWRSHVVGIITDNKKDRIDYLRRRSSWTDCLHRS